MRNPIHFFDIYAPKAVTLTLDGKTHHKSSCGGFLAILVFSVVLLFTGLYF